MGELVERVDENDHPLHVTDRSQAVQNGWLHRVAGVVCRDAQGRILIHRRSTQMPWFGGQYAALIGGAVRAGESYVQAAEREALEELGIHTTARYLFKFICHGAVGTYWFGIHEAVIDQPVTPDPCEIDWHTWLTPADYRTAAASWPLIPDTEEAYGRYLRSRRP
ncbi:NUDIX hydrolase [Streptomyces sp. NPDC002092]